MLDGHVPGAVLVAGIGAGGEPEAPVWLVVGAVEAYTAGRE
jgi:hypothetical protein